MLQGIAQDGGGGEDDDETILESPLSTTLHQRDEVEVQDPPLEMKEGVGG